MTVGSKSSEDEEEADKSYHTDEFYRWHMNQLDPSIALVSQKVPHKRLILPNVYRIKF